MKYKRCGQCEFFLKIKWNDNAKSSLPSKKRNGICEKYDYNVLSDGTYASICKGYKKKKYERRLNNGSIYGTC